MTNITPAIKRGRPRLPTEQKCGTTTGYAQGCRCEKCRAAWAAYRRGYNARPEVQQRLALKLLQSTPEGRKALRAAIMEEIVAKGGPETIFEPVNPIDLV